MESYIDKKYLGNSGSKFGGAENAASFDPHPSSLISEQPKKTKGKMKPLQEQQ